MAYSRLETKAERDFSNFVNHKTEDSCVKLEITHWPDRIIFVSSGHCFFIEFKRNEKYSKQRLGQRGMTKVLKKMGFSVYVCRSLEEAKNAYEKEKAIASTKSQTKTKAR